MVVVDDDDDEDVDDDDYDDKDDAFSLASTCVWVEVVVKTNCVTTMGELLNATFGTLEMICFALFVFESKVGSLSTSITAL